MRLVGPLLSILCVLSAPAWGKTFDYVGVDLEGRRCHIPQGYGPFDYRLHRQGSPALELVQTRHFTPKVEQLIKGQSAPLLQDIDYTLRAFPNHHRALFALIRYYTESGHPPPNARDIRGAPECYLQRALRFTPDDGKVELLFGLYLHKLGRLDAAEPHYRRAVKLLPNDSEAYYNLGLLLTDQHKYAEAIPVARRAYELGYPLAGLRRRLAAAGHPIN